MFDMTQPIQAEVIVGSILLIVGLIGMGLALVRFYKRRDNGRDR
jgi:hypothetical protein